MSASMPSHTARPHSSCNSRGAESRDHGASCIMVMAYHGVALFSGLSSCHLAFSHWFHGRGNTKVGLLQTFLMNGAPGGQGGPNKAKDLQNNPKQFLPGSPPSWDPLFWAILGRRISATATDEKMPSRDLRGLARSLNAVLPCRLTQRVL